MTPGLPQRWRTPECGQRDKPGVATSLRRRAPGWSNWSGTEIAEPEIIHPRADEVGHAIKGAAGRRVKAVGSGHSFTGIARAEDVQLVLDRQASLVAADARTGLVTVEAGMTLRHLNRVLESLRLSMTNLGDIDAQTIAGAISTGTHGTGARFGGLAAQVAGFALTLADGSTINCSPTEHAEVFRAGRVGLGALGVLTTVTLRTEPLFALRAQEAPMAIEEVLARFDEFADGTDHFEFYWFPHTEKTLTKRNTRVPVDRRDPLPRWRSTWDDEILSNGAFAAVVGAGRRIPALVEPLSRLAGSALGARSFTDVSHKVFVSARRVRFVEMEYAVPRSDAVNVVREIKATIERRAWRVAFPIEVRVAAADDIPLSTGSGRDSAYVAVHLPVGVDYEPYFRAVEAIAGQVGGRPHWGKINYLDRSTLAARYPAFDEFVEVRDRLDPSRMFANAYLDRMLGA